MVNSKKRINSASQKKHLSSEAVRAWFTRKVWLKALSQAKIFPDEVATDWFLADGKRLRPLLAARMFAALGGSDEKAILPVALAVECFHKASLVHDDIEDGDTMRYGRASVHAEHGVPCAINAGDWLLGVGYALMGTAALPGERIAELVGIAAWGHVELARGQGDELAFCAAPRPLSVDEAIAIYSRKTATAFNVALQCGACAAGLGRRHREVLAQYADAAGIAFQIRDDEADITAEQGRESDFCSLRPTLYLALACRSRSASIKRALAAVWTGDAGARRRLAEAIAASAIPGRVVELRKKYVRKANEKLRELPAGVRQLLEGLLPL